MRTGSVFLCGFMGVGKSTVGKVVASRMQLPFFDTDEVIVKNEKRTIPQIFKVDGEARFRALESEAIEEVCGKGPAIVALGGGALNAKENLEIILASGTLIYLQADIRTLEERLAATAQTRPLLSGLSTDERRKQITSLMKARQDLYEKAEFKIQTDRRTPDQIADEILLTLKRKMS